MANRKTAGGGAPGSVSSARGILPGVASASRTPPH